MGTAIKHPMTDLSVRVPGCQKLQPGLNPVWHGMLYSCTHMATVGVKGLSGQLDGLCMMQTYHPFRQSYSFDIEGWNMQLRARSDVYAVGRPT